MLVSRFLMLSRVFFFAFYHYWNSLEVDIDDGPFGSELGIHNWVCKAGSFRDAVDS